VPTASTVHCQRSFNAARARRSARVRPGRLDQHPAPPRRHRQRRAVQFGGPDHPQPGTAGRERRVAASLAEPRLGKAVKIGFAGVRTDRIGPGIAELAAAWRALH
jgi:hypothetical protein